MSEMPSGSAAAVSSAAYDAFNKAKYYVYTPEYITVLFVGLAVLIYMWSKRNLNTDQKIATIALSFFHPFVGCFYLLSIPTNKNRYRQMKKHMMMKKYKRKYSR